MELSPILISLPAFVALSFKVGIYAYARFSPTHNRQTQLYLLTLFALSIQNLGEIGHFLVLAEGSIPRFQVGAFYLASVAALAFMFHLSYAIAIECRDGRRRSPTPWLALVYGCAAIIAALLIFTELLIVDYVPFGYSVTRVPGPLYFLFETFALGVAISIVAMLISGARAATSPQRRAKANLLLAAVIPMLLVAIVVVTLLHFGIRWFNASVTNPIAITYFLAVTACAIHQHRVFDIQFYIPWSKVRKRKTAFYNRIRALIAEIADLDSPNQLIDRLAETLRCPVALVGGERSVMATAGGSAFMAEIPQSTLKRFDHIVVANEITEKYPDAYEVMQRHGVAAIVPFYPHSKHAAGWLLLGDSFSEHIYSRLDFKVVEQLFDKMADLFLDKLLAMRNQVAQAARQLRDVERRYELVNVNLTTLSSEIESLRTENSLLRRERAADSLSPAVTAAVTNEAQSALPPSVILLGRDKTMLKTLRAGFPQVQSYVSADSAGFRRQPLPEVIVARIESNEAPVRLAELLIRNGHEMAAVLYGPGASAFVSTQQRALRGRLVETLAPEVAEEIIVRRVQALATLRRASFVLDDGDQPLLGASLVMKEQMSAAARMAGFSDPVLLRSSDFDHAVALARALHARSGVKGNCHVVYPHELSAPAGAHAVASVPALVAERIADCRHGTLVVVGLDMLAYEVGVALSDLARAADARMVATAGPDAIGLAERFRPMIIDMPSLRERRADVPLLVHYFTLQHNLQAGTNGYMKQFELDELLADDYPEDVASLKRAVFTRLSSRCDVASMDHGVLAAVEAADRGDKGLDAQLEEFEARVIAETLERCAGNKSKAARLLGLRPNTLHYKLERFGLTTTKKP